MGVPKFYRWLSERYACLSQVIKDHQIPEFDNLYLDMNGIIHPCSHPNDDDPHFRITEEQIFKNIFHYIEVLFRIIKPQKVFFMAVDGVAPRAKMNQQRSRRFRSAKEAEDNIRKALQKGEVLPTEERFDSNCITPGTEFMVRLHEHLKYFVNKKITTDPGWQGINIYLSGHETPGEGEHKVMDFIRYERSQPGYDHNTRHCLYGLDADLIMLGLTSHDPHFSLLREEIRFGKNAKRVSNPEEITFHLLHLSLLREYIDWEFDSLKTKISFEYDVEKIIDDWILMGFLVGNDFIPNLPNFHINHDALPYLWKVYKDVMPTLDGYLHDGGFLNLSRFESYLKTLSKFDLEKFEDAYVDLKWLEGKQGASKEEEESDSQFETDEIDSSAKKLEKVALESSKKSNKLRDYLEEKGVLKEAEEEDDGDFSKEHEKYKLQYYVEKFELKEDESCSEFVKTLCLKYVEAIQWILHYYFNGVPSWGWFFHYHYAPYASDIKDFKDEEFPFDIGRAFLPFEQLLAVLPAASKKLLPESFRDLMIMEHSPIIDYYPLEFNTDLNGKRQDWEAVVLIPFIDETRLVAAMEPRCSRLNNSEKKRNRHSPCLLYTFDKDKSEKYPSPLACASFPDLECCHASSEEVPIEKYRLSSEQITKGVLPAVKLDIYFPGFPTLKHVPHTGEMKKVGVKVFQMHSRGESMVLKIDESEEPDIKEVAELLLGNPCYVGWPHLVEAFVTSVSDGKVKFFMSKQATEHVQEVKLSASDASAWKKQSSCESQFYLEKKAVDVGMVHVIVEACQIQGKKHVCDARGIVQLEKVWSEWAVAFPFQVTVKNISIFDETDAAAACANIADLFPVGTECFMMAIPHYGSSGKVIEVDLKQNRVRVQLMVVPELDLLSLMEKQEEFADVYMPAYVMAKRLGVTTHVLAQITGKVFVAIGEKEGSSKVDIGLNLKFSKQNKEVLGYARRFGTSWSYSPKTERVISMYQEKYPEVFDVLSNSSSQERYMVSEVFPKADKSKILSEVKNWLKTLPSHNQTAVPCGSDTLDEPIVKQIEDAVEKLKGEKQNKKNVKVRVKATVLHRPMKHMGQIPPDPDAVFELFDRVVNVRTLGVAPYGLKGTIVGIHKGKTEKDEKSYEVLFDEPFMGGQSLRGSFENKLFVVHAWSLLNLTHGVRLEEKKKGRPSPHAQQRRSGQHLQGAPADYRPSGRAGSRNMYDSLGDWRTPLNATSPDRKHGHSPQRPGPEYRFPSPRHNSPFSQQSHLKQRPGFRPRLLLNPQNSPHGNNRLPNSHQQPVSSKASDTVETTLSAKESERMIKELLKMDGAGKDAPSSKTKLNNTDHNPSMPPMSPISPSAASAPSGILAMICSQNRWPPPSFSHHMTPQGYISTLCVAGKLYQGVPAATIVESTESVACVALSVNGLWPQAFPFSPPLMNNPRPHSLPRPGFPYAPPGHPLRPPVLRHQGHAQSGPPKRNHNVERKADSENWRQTTPVSDDTEKSSESPRNSPSSTEVKIEPKSNLSGGQRKELFIPLQVSLKNKDVPIASKSNVQVEPKLSEKTSEPERNEASPKPSENEATSKEAKAEAGKADPGKADPGKADPGKADPGKADPGKADPEKPKPKLLAPSFFQAPRP